MTVISLSTNYQPNNFVNSFVCGYGLFTLTTGRLIYMLLFLNIYIFNIIIII